MYLTNQIFLILSNRFVAMQRKKKVSRPKLKRYVCSNTIFQVTDRYKITGYLGAGGYGIVV